MTIGGIGGFSSLNNYKELNNTQNRKDGLPTLSGDNTPSSDKPGVLNPDSKKIDENAKKGCESCKNRTYKDQSNDAGVSFKSPQKIGATAARTMVAAHEQEHVTRNQSKADREGREVISSSVQIHSSICTECGKPYVSGGTTKTVTANKRRFDAGLPDPLASGNNMDKTA